MESFNKETSKSFNLKKRDFEDSSIKISSKKKMMMLISPMKKPYFTPFSNERDNLGRLKPPLEESQFYKENSPEKNKEDKDGPINDALSRTTHYEPRTSQNKSLGYFKKDYGFERQINVIIRNKKLMKYIKFFSSKLTKIISF